MGESSGAIFGGIEVCEEWSSDEGEEQNNDGPQESTPILLDNQQLLIKNEENNEENAAVSPPPFLHAQPRTESPPPVLEAAKTPRTKGRRKPKPVEEETPPLLEIVKSQNARTSKISDDGSPPPVLVSGWAGSNKEDSGPPPELEAQKDSIEELFLKSCMTLDDTAIDSGSPPPQLCHDYVTKPTTANQGPQEALEAAIEDGRVQSDQVYASLIQGTNAAAEPCKKNFVCRQCSDRFGCFKELRTHLRKTHQAGAKSALGYAEDIKKRTEQVRQQIESASNEQQIQDATTELTKLNMFKAQKRHYVAGKKETNLTDSLMDKAEQAQKALEKTDIRNSTDYRKLCAVPAISVNKKSAQLKNPPKDSASKAESPQLVTIKVGDVKVLKVAVNQTNDKQTTKPGLPSIFVDSKVEEKSDDSPPPPPPILVTQQQTDESDSEENDADDESSPDAAPPTLLKQPRRKRKQLIRSDTDVDDSAPVLKAQRRSPRKHKEAMPALQPTKKPDIKSVSPGVSRPSNSKPSIAESQPCSCQLCGVTLFSESAVHKHIERLHADTLKDMGLDHMSYKQFIKVNEGFGQSDKALAKWCGGSGKEFMEKMNKKDDDNMPVIEDAQVEVPETLKKTSTIRKGCSAKVLEMRAAAKEFTHKKFRSFKHETIREGPKKFEYSTRRLILPKNCKEIVYNIEGRKTYFYECQLCFQQMPDKVSAHKHLINCHSAQNAKATK